VKLRVGQHLFTKERDHQDKVMWRCENRTCGARVHTVNGEIVKWQNPIHRHPAVPGKAEVEGILAAMKERAAATAEPISHIVNTFYARVEVGWAHLIQRQTPSRGR